LSLVCEAAQATSHIVRRSQTFPLRVLPLKRLPALSLLPGHSPAQLATWAADGNWSIWDPKFGDHAASRRPPDAGYLHPITESLPPAATGAVVLLSPQS